MPWLTISVSFTKYLLSTCCVQVLYAMQWRYKILKINRPFATTWTNLEHIMLSEISQRKTNTV